MSGLQAQQKPEELLDLEGKMSLSERAKMELTAALNTTELENLSLVKISSRIKYKQGRPFLLLIKKSRKMKVGTRLIFSHRIPVLFPSN